MTTPIPRADSDATWLGPLIDEYGGNLRRFLPLVAGIFCFILSIPPSHASNDIGLGARLIVIAMGIACFAGYFFFGGRGAQALLFTRGFSISRAGRTITGQWEDIASIRHGVNQRFYLFGLLPVAWTTSDTYTLTLTDGRRLHVSGAHFSHAQELGDTMQRMWARALERRASNRS
ncbi:MAG TPA: hypothetical protein VGS80_22925 [Ktedonobacterales bacterium]|nr:hypothetical protein [Ktedonobacterales bacterium]